MSWKGHLIKAGIESDGSNVNIWRGNLTVYGDMVYTGGVTIEGAITFEGAIDAGVADATGGGYGMKITDTATFVAVAAHKALNVDLTYTPATAGTGCPIGVVGKVSLNGDLTAANNYPGMGWGVQGQIHIVTGSTIDGSTYGDPGAIYAGVRGVVTDAGTSTYTKGILTAIYADMQLSQNASAGANFEVFGIYSYIYKAGTNSNIDAIICTDIHASVSAATVERSIYVKNTGVIGIEIGGAQTDGLLISGACSDNAIEITGACSDSAIKIVGTAMIASGEQAFYISCAAETVAATGIWNTIRSTVTSGDLCGIRCHIRSDAASGTNTVRAMRGEAEVGASKVTALATGVLAEVDVSAGSCEATTIEILTVQFSEGASLTATNFAGIKLNIQTLGTESFGGYDAGIYLNNEGHGGAGRTIADGILITESAHSATTAFTDGIHISAVCTNGINLAGAMTDGIIISGACADNAIEITGACSDSAIKIVGTAMIASGEQAFFINCQSETAAVTGIWNTVRSTVTSGDLCGIRCHTRSNAASGTNTIRAGRFEAEVGASKTTALATGALIEVDVSAGICTATSIEILNIHFSRGATLTATNFCGIKMNIQSDGAESFGGVDAGIYMVNEAVGGNGRTINDGILFANVNHTASGDAFTNGITFSGKMTHAMKFTASDETHGASVTSANPQTCGGIIKIDVAGTDYYIPFYAAAQVTNEWAD